MTEEIDPAVAKILEHRRFVLKEFVDSEREYVERLRVTVEDYLNHIRAGGPDIPPTLKMDILSIFSTLPDIFTFHREVLLPALQGTDLEDAEAMVSAFLEHGSEFTNKYVAYCKNKPVSDSTRLEYDDFFSSRQTELGQKLNIEDLLIAPVQRLPRYQLLIRDLLKDTRKVKMDTSKIEEALELMTRIPKETNNMIGMSLLRGIPRANVISHGSLWRQESLLFSSAIGAKEEQCQVYLFDHQIIVATPADGEGFYHFKLGIKTLNGKVTEGSGAEFHFIEDGGTEYHFRADKRESADNWISDLQSILTSQLQMKKALIFGKCTTSITMSRTQSIGMEWSDSDSSIDSMPDSDSDLEGDWPKNTGFTSLDMSVKKPVLTVSKTKNSKTKAKEAKKKSPVMIRKLQPSKSLMTSSLNSLSPPVKFRPHSASFADIEQSVLRKSDSLSVSPGLLHRLLAHKSLGTAAAASPGYIHYPHTSHSLNPPRSPGAFRKVSEVVESAPERMYYIALDNQPGVAHQVYRPPPGQVFQPLDVRLVDVWRVRVLSGSNAGEEVWLQRSMIEEYTAPLSTHTVKKSYSIVNKLGRGRFSEVRLARLKSNKKLVAIKALKEGTSEESFFRELCITSRLHHDNLVGCQGGVHNGGMAIILDNINGRQLFDHLVRKSSVIETTIAHVINQLLSGLHYLHSHTIVHLDVRPSNVMIHLTRTTDVVKLIDFGAARHYGEDLLTQQFEPMSDYQYTAPEVLQQQSIGPGCDVWGVGVILYTILYGYNPFCGGSNIHTIANITAGKYLLPSSQSSPEASQLIKDIFVLSTRKRPNAESAMSYDWFKRADSFKQNKIDIGQLKQFMRNQKSS